MVQRFGSREICDVTFKALNPTVINGYNIAKGQPVFVIDTAQTSNMEQASTVVYAQGGRGYNRLIAWEGEKTMTFNVTDALMSPLGLSMLTNAGLVDATANAPVHVHTTIDEVCSTLTYASVATSAAADLDKYYTKSGDIYTKATTYSNSETYYVPTVTAKVSLETLVAELGLDATKTDKVAICNDANVKIYGTVLDHNGAIAGWADTISVASTSTSNGDGLVYAEKGENKEVTFTIEGDSAISASAKTVKFDFYAVMFSGATQITIKPEDFGGYFYVEADTLYRNEDGKDMAATLTFPKVKINSAFTITMAANGDPSTFDFQMDAMPGYTYFDKAHKVVCDITIVGGSEGDTNIFHTDEDHVG